MKKLVLLPFLLLLVGCVDNNQPEEEPEFNNTSYDPSSNIENGDVVQTNQGYHNVEKLDQFIEKFNEGKEVELEIVQVTTEGNPRFKNLTYNENKIQLSSHHTEDS
ncbi:DUF4362 domain-containing protein [Alteribacillus sp. YIM 98480]|uniref:DUF4362 domain-containing protein n=1 Tax=Alteribacillus sp. YIM 98480 TaxID=2606599 RepID=UPI00131BC770|nr:DUF4362 domain-containing protein [Alteribacillus sp. YIM 98480]